MVKNWLFLFLFILPFGASAQLEIPPLTDPVIDQAGLITGKDQRFLRNLILAFHERGKGQIQVLTLRNLGGLTIEQASIQIVDRWKIGDKKRDDGVLILVAAQERAMRIEVGQGLEGVLPDITAKRIISDVMIPVFRQGSPSQGIVLGTFQVMKTIDPTFEDNNDMAPTNVRPESLMDRYEGLFILIFIIIMILLNLIRPRRRSFWGGGGWGGGGFGGGGWGGGSGGGWSGGGGGFSGGGASGNW